MCKVSMIIDDNNNFLGEIQGSTIHTALDVLNETEDTYSLEV